MFNNETLHVVDYYNTSLKSIDEKNIDDCFKNQILKDARINVGANRETADHIDDLDKKIQKTSKSASAAKGGMIAMRVIGIILICAGIFLIVMGALHHFTPEAAYIGGGSGGIVLGGLLFGLSWLVKGKYKREEQILASLQTEREKEYKTALMQLADFKTRFNSNMVFDIFEKTYPLIHFDDFFSEAAYANWTLWLQNDVNSTVLYCLSGNVKTNPFIVLRTNNTKLYDHVYTGSVTRMVPVTTFVNGRSQTSMQTIIVTASTTNPAPMYWNETKLFYKSNAADDLIFENISAFKNEKKAEKYFEKNKEMEPMDNPEFDKLFPCKRNNETQFRTLFSPLAQEEMIKLMKTKNDYEFKKHKSLNIISSPSFESINMNYNFDRYLPMYDYETIKDDFYSFNQDFFSNIYFMFAPILVIPLYQQYEYHQPPFEKKMVQLMSYMETESAVNGSFNPLAFAHPNSKTQNILKTKRVFQNTQYEINQVIAYGYNTRTRVVVKTVMDPRAGPTAVPITIIDYLPVQQSKYVVNSYVPKTNRDVSLNASVADNNPWLKYFKSLGASAFAKVGNVSSMLLSGQKPTVDKDTYKEFLDKITKNA